MTPVSTLTAVLALTPALLQTPELTEALASTMRAASLMPARLSEAMQVLEHRSWSGAGAPRPRAMATGS